MSVSFEQKRVKSVPQKPKITPKFERLIKSPRNRNIKLFIAKGKGSKKKSAGERTHFKVNGQRFAGVTTTIQTYWGKPYVPHEVKEKNSKYVAKSGNCRFKCKSSDAMKHGKIVDDEISFLATHGLEKLRKSKHCKGKLENLDRCTYNLLLFLKKKMWKPVLAQFPIYSSEFRLATAIDLICVSMDGTQQLILLELKATLNQDDSTYRHQDRTMAPPLDRVYNSYANHHQLQLALMWRMLTRDYGIEPDLALVVRVCATSVTEYEMEEWCEICMPEIVEFLSTQKKPKNARKAKYK